MPCYTPAGRNINTDVWGVPEGALYSPCTNGTVSMCCAIGYERGAPDVCVDNGLCHNSYAGNQLWRESCTDPTWQDPACVKLFVNGTGINATMGTEINDSSGKLWDDIQVTDCGGGMYCYGDDNANCCRLNQGVYLLNGEQVAFDPLATSSITSSASSTSSSSSSPTSAFPSSSEGPSATNDAQSSPTAINVSSSDTNSGDLSTGAKAGIGVGVSLGVLALLAIMSWIVWRRRKQRRGVPAQNVERVQDYKDHSQESSTPALMTFETDSQVPSELPQSHRVDRRYELPGG